MREKEQRTAKIKLIKTRTWNNGKR